MENLNVQESKAFMDGKKAVAIISDVRVSLSWGVDYIIWHISIVGAFAIMLLTYTFLHTLPPFHSQNQQAASSGISLPAFCHFADDVTQSTGCIYWHLTACGQERKEPTATDPLHN
jgi:hypothetical protein